MNHPSLPDEVIKNTATVYYRFHGAPRLYYSAYSKAYLQNVIHQIKQSRKVKEAFIYFNNTALGHAVKNAREMRGMG